MAVGGIAMGAGRKPETRGPALSRACGSCQHLIQISRQSLAASLVGAAQAMSLRLLSPGRSALRSVLELSNGG
jgi:hypothetical protein